MGAGTKKGQFSLGYGHKNMTEVGVYFKQKIQSNSLLWPNRVSNIPLQIWHLYAYKRIYLVWCLCLPMEESGAFVVSTVFVGLKRIFVERVWFYL